MIDNEGKEYSECVVGNIIGDHYFGENKEIRNGIKTLRAGAKVYCVFKYGGMGHERIVVMGLPRKSHRMIEIVIRTAYVKNFRVQKVYDPKILEFLKKHNAYNDPYSHFISQEGLDSLNAQQIEIKE